MLARSPRHVGDDVVEELAGQGIEMAIETIVLPTDEAGGGEVLPPIVAHREALSRMGATPRLMNEARVPGAFVEAVEAHGGTPVFGVLVRTTDEVQTVELSDGRVRPQQVLQRCVRFEKDCVIVACASDDGDCLRAVEVSWENAARGVRSRTAPFFPGLIRELTDVLAGPVWIVELEADPDEGTTSGRVVRIGR